MLRRRLFNTVVSIGAILAFIAGPLSQVGSAAARSIESTQLQSNVVASPSQIGAAGVQREQAATQAPIAGSPPVESRLVRAHTFTGDLRNLPSVKPVKRERPEREEPVPNPIELRSSGNQGFGLTAPIGPSAPAPAPNITFDGLGYVPWGAGHPPDPNGDVGPTYYIQTINTSIGIYTKTTGSLVTAFTFDTLMSLGSFGNLCDTDNFGDPVVLYDTFEDRWIITDFAFQLDGSNNVINPPGAFECFAVSRSGDPVSGGWNFYSVNTTGGLGDYPKLGIWPDGLYMSVNMFDYSAAGSFQNVRVYAFNKSQMYAGDSTVQVVSFDVADAGEFTLLPANARLQAGTPPAGTPNYFISTWEYLNALTVYKFHVDWNNTAASTFTGPDTPLTGSSWPNATVPNAATPGNSLDVLQIRAMVQNQYTNIGGAESLWTTHTVRRANTAGFAAPRWYQVNVTGGTVAANTVQAATWDPDGANVTYRFMPSLAVDRMGDMAIGYSTSNSTTDPGMKYAGRLYTDTLSTLPQTEQTLYQGTGTQTGSCGGTCTRWGDYSAMTLDPNGCTFWYTNEYYAVNGLNYLTRIGSFQFPSCTIVGNGGTISGTVVDAGSSTPLNGVTVTLGSRITTTNSSGVYQFPNLPAGVYPGMTASYPGFSSSSAGPITVADNLTTTQNFALSVTSVTWNGNADTNWFIASNWNPAAVPVTTTNVIIPTTPSGSRWPILTGTTAIYTLTVQSGAAVTITQGITLSVNGGVVNNGTLVQTKNAPASATTEFLHITDATGATTKYRGVDLTTPNNLGITTVVITTTTGSTCTTTLGGSPNYVHRCYAITPTTNAASTVRLWALTSELNGILEANLVPYHYSGGTWTPLTSVSTGNDGGSYSFAQGDTPSFSSFLVGSGNAPTAITERDLVARSSDFTLLIVLMAFVGLVGALTLWQVRRRAHTR